MDLKKNCFRQKSKKIDLVNIFRRCYIMKNEFINMRLFLFCFFIIHIMSQSCQGIHFSSGSLVDDVYMFFSSQFLIKADSQYFLRTWITVTADFQYLKYSLSQTFWNLEQMSLYLVKQLRQTTIRYYKLSLCRTVF